MVQDINAAFRLARLVAFSVACLFAFIILALGAAIINFTTTKFVGGGYFSFAALGVANGVLTLVSLPVMLWVSINRKTAITSMISVEIAWTSFLWIMWLALAGLAASTEWLGHCSLFISSVESMCQQSQALTAFAFLTWILLLAYNVGLVFLAIRQHTRGNTTVWNSYILETDFAAPGQVVASSDKNLEAASVAQPAQPAQYPPAAQQPQQPYIPAAQAN